MNGAATTAITIGVIWLVIASLVAFWLGWTLWGRK